MAETKLVIALINLALGVGISVLVAFRINALPHGMAAHRVTPYALLLTGGLVSGFQPWMGHWPTPNELFYSSAVFLYLFCTRHTHNHP